MSLIRKEELPSELGGEGGRWVEANRGKRKRS